MDQYKYLFMGAMIFIIAGSVILANKIQSKSSTAVIIKWNNDVEKYKGIVKMLPQHQVERLHQIVYKAGTSINLPTTELPDELSKLVTATTAIIKSNSFGVIPAEKENQSHKIITEFENQLNSLVPVINRALKDVYGENGLDFGIITTSAADMALYNAMDNAEKNKKADKTILHYTKQFDEEVIRFRSELLDILVYH